MLEPLLASRERENGHVEEGQLLLHCLMARIELLRSGSAHQVLELLGSYEDSARRSSLRTTVRAEVALWLGWARSWQDDEFYNGARALALLDEAERAFREEMSPAGRCWTLIGQAHAYFTIDEYELMLKSLREAASLQQKLGDVSAEMWIRHLSTIGARFEGRYAEALHHADELERLAEAHQDELSLGRANAHRAIIFYEIGRRPEHVIEAAQRAEELLLAASERPGYALLSAYHAHIGALLRKSAWNEAERLIDGALTRVGRLGTASGYISLHKAKLLLSRGELGPAISLLEQVRSGIHHQHRLLSSNVERIWSEVLCARGDFAGAAELAEKALRSAREAGHAGYRLGAILQLAHVALSEGQGDRANELINEAEKYSDYFTLLPFAAQRFLIHGRLAVLRDRSDDARAHLAQALSAFSLIGDAHSVALVQYELSRLNLQVSPADSRPMADAALSAFERMGAAPDAHRARMLLRSWPSITDTGLEGRETDVGSIVARAAISVDLVAEAWLQAAEKLAPGRWLVVYRYDAGGKWTRVHHHGNVPAALTFPDAGLERVCEEGVDWMRLRGVPGPAFFFGMECGGENDPACRAIEQRLLPWIPVVGLALEHALLRSSRLGNPPLPEETRLPLEELVFSSAAMQDLVQQIRRIRSSRSPLLISGEPGTGKSLVARCIHQTGDRLDKPFVVFSCSAEAASSAARSLFGSSAHGGGAVHAARGGTLVLDEIAELSPDVQQRLLRFLEEPEALTDAGARLDVRIIATTSADLRDLVTKGRFREDLYYRLNVIPLRVPPLRQRREEIPLLVHHFLKLTGTPNASVTTAAMEALIRYDWPCNVRQLRNEVERLVVLSRSEPAALIDAGDLSDAIRSGNDSVVVDHVAVNGRGLDEILSSAEKTVIEKVLAENDGQVSAAADELGLTRQGLYKKMKRLGIDTSQFHQSVSTR